MPYAVDGETMAESMRMNVFAYQACILGCQHPDPLLRYWENRDFQRYCISINVSLQLGQRQGVQGHTTLFAAFGLHDTIHVSMMLQVHRPDMQELIHPHAGPP